MVDLESLNTTPGAVILSIGAVKFDLESGKIDEEGFYARLDMEEQFTMGRTVSGSTIKWWMEQSDVARAVFKEQSIPLDDALASFIKYATNKKDDIIVWANGPEFDITILGDLFHQKGMDLPWKFWNAESVRTYRRLPGADRIPKEPVLHNALMDAVAQAKHVCAIHQALFKKAKK